MMKATLQTLMASLPEPVIHHIQHLERIRQDFVANVSHELRTPLTVVHGYLEVLLSEASGALAPWEKIFTQMQQQTLRMENLVENLLLLSRLENEDESGALDALVAVEPLLKVLLQEAQGLSGEAQHHITLKADPKLLLKGSAEELRSLFSNLILNAIKYTPARGHILIKWSCNQRGAFFSVKDSGIGIAAKHIPRLTERFYRVDRGRSRASGGTGLGLAIAKHVLIRHQGVLKIASELNKGSTFTCVFPLKRTKYNGPRSSSRGARHAGLKK